MTKRQVMREVCKAQQLLELGEWHITAQTLDAEVIDDEGNWAALHTQSESLKAHIVLATKRDDAKVREAIMHEMLHLAFNECYETILRITDGMSAEARGLARSTARAAEERMIIRLTRAFTQNPN